MSDQGPGCVRYFQASGGVQNVMIRQTLVRGARKRGVEAGASNPDPDDKRLVDLTLRCASADAAKAIDEMVAFMRSGRHLNCWEAWIDQLDELPHGKPISEHEVNTDNVDSFQWNSDEEMYL